jgi:hypothetical protein
MHKARVGREESKEKKEKYHYKNTDNITDESESHRQFATEYRPVVAGLV